MAIANVNASLQATAAAKTGQIIATGPSDAQAFVYRGTGTATGDGVASSFTLNWIDGTQVLPFIPSAVIGTASGGTAAATISIASFTSITATSALVTLSAVPANLATFIFGFICLK